MLDKANEIIECLDYPLSGQVTGTCYSTSTSVAGGGYRYTCNISLPTDVDIANVRVTAPTDAGLSVNGNIATVSGTVLGPGLAVNCTVRYDYRPKLLS